MSFQQFGFGRNDDQIGNNKKRFKAEAGRRYRVSFAWWRGIEEGSPDLNADGPEFVGAPANYIPGVGYIINRGPEYTKLAGGEPPRMKIATIIVVWPMDSKGNLDKHGIANGDFDVQPWVFGQDKYKALEPVHKEFHFGEHDVTISCTDTQYQKMTFSPCKDSLLSKLQAKGGPLWKSIVDQAQLLATGIQNEIGREMSLDDLREKLSGSGGNAAAPTTSVATEDIDNLVDNLLDD